MVAGEHRLPVRRSSPSDRRAAPRRRRAPRPTTSSSASSATRRDARGPARHPSRLPGPEPPRSCATPGYADDDLRRESGYADERETEIRVLCDPAARAAVRTEGLRADLTSAIDEDARPLRRGVGRRDRGRARISRPSLSWRSAGGRGPVVAFPTGRTMVPLYAELARGTPPATDPVAGTRVQSGRARSCPRGHPATFPPYMRRHAYGRTGLVAARCDIPRSDRRTLRPSAPATTGRSPAPSPVARSIS